MREKQFENNVKKWLETQGIYKLGASKFKTAPCGYYEKRLGSAMTGAGKPDLLVVVKGQAVEVELKAETGRPSELQKYILSQINNSGCRGMILYPKDFETFKNYIMELKNAI